MRGGHRPQHTAARRRSGLELHAEPLPHLVLDPGDQRVDVGRGGAPRVDHEPAVLLGDLRAAHARPAQTRVHDELAGEVADRALERRPGARHLERLLLLAAAAVVVHRRMDHRAVPGGEREGGREHGQALVVDAAPAVSHSELPDPEDLQRPAPARAVREDGAGHVHADGLEDVGDAGIVGPGVHMAGAAHRPRDAPQRLHPGELGLLRREGHIAQQGACLGAHARARGLDAGEVVAQKQDRPADAAVAHQQVRPGADDGDRDRCHRAHVEDAGDGVLVRRGDHHVGGAADLEGRVARHGLEQRDGVLARRPAQSAEHLVADAVVLVHGAPPRVSSLHCRHDYTPSRTGDASLR